MTFTAQDVVDHLLTTTGGGAQDGEHRAVRQAVIHGVREVFQTRQWLWHTKTGYFATQQISTTATAIISGSNQITVASSTGMVVGRLLDIPADYFSYPVRITAISGTTVTLDAAAKKTKGAETVTVLVQTYYDLPADLKDIDALVTDTVGTLHCYITPQEWQRLETNSRGSGEPYYYTLMRSDVFSDRYQVRFVGVPQNATVVHYTYRYIPKIVKYMGYEPVCRKGTVAVSSSTVTGTGTQFPADCAGAVIRFGSATTEADPIGALSPFQQEREIGSRQSDTALTLSTPITGSISGTVKYALSDAIDCSPQMYTAVLSAAEMWYARLAGKPAIEAVQLFNRDLRLAMENDVVSPLSGRPRMLDYPTARSMGWKSAPLPDQG
jgi:hypothetical protein